MRITASWLDPTVGSTEYKDVARDLRCHPSAGSPQIVSALLAALRRAIATGCAVPDAAESAAVLGPVKDGLEMLRGNERLGDGHP
jgi:hypothetical protein